MTKDEKAKIDAMSQEDMARLWRFAPAGHPYFVSGSRLSEYFIKVFRGKGGMTPAVSKSIGWDR